MASQGQLELILSALFRKYILSILIHYNNDFYTVQAHEARFIVSEICTQLSNLSLPRFPVVGGDLSRHFNFLYNFFRH